MSHLNVSQKMLDLIYYSERKIEVKSSLFYLCNFESKNIFKIEANDIQLMFGRLKIRKIYEEIIFHFILRTNVFLLSILVGLIIF